MKVRQALAVLLLGTLSLYGAASIPRFDVDEILEATGPERFEKVQEFGDALRDVGFVAVAAPQLKELRAKVYEQMNLYFHQSDEVKSADESLEGEAGWIGRGRYFAAGAKNPDHREIFDAPTGFDRWPESCPEFGSTMMEYREEIQKVIAKVMAITFEYLGEDPDVYVSQMPKCNIQHRCAYYPAPEPDAPYRQYWAAPHWDLSAFSVLPCSTIPGLYLYSKEGERLPVQVGEDDLIFNTGEQLERLTGGYIKATLHEVINPGGEYAEMERLVTIFFVGLPLDQSLAPLKTALARATQNMSDEERAVHEARFTPCTAAEYMEARFIEQRVIKSPNRERVVHLRGLGLIKEVPDHLREQWPDLFEEE